MSIITTIRRICAAAGVIALVYGMLLLMGAVEAWCFTEAPRGIMLVLGGVAGMEIGEVFE